MMCENMGEVSGRTRRASWGGGWTGLDCAQPRGTGRLLQCAPLHLPLTMFKNALVYRIDHWDAARPGRHRRAPGRPRASSNAARRSRNRPAGWSRAARSTARCSRASAARLDPAAVHRDQGGARRRGEDAARSAAGEDRGSDTGRRPKGKQAKELKEADRARRCCRAPSRSARRRWSGSTRAPARAGRRGQREEGRRAWSPGWWNCSAAA